MASGRFVIVIFNVEGYLGYQLLKSCTELYITLTQGQVDQSLQLMHMLLKTQQRVALISQECIRKPSKHEICVPVLAAIFSWPTFTVALRTSHS